MEAFERGANAYLKEGSLLRAMAMCKLILSLDPSHEQIQSTMLKLHEVPVDQIKPPAGPARGGSASRAARFKSIPVLPEAADNMPGTSGDVAGAQPLSGLCVLGEKEIDMNGVDQQNPDLDAPLLPPLLKEQTVAGRRAAPGAPDSTRSRGLMVDLTPDNQDRGDAAGVFEIRLDREARVESRPELKKDHLTDRLPPIPLLSSLSRHELVAFTHRVEVRQYEPKEVVIRQGSVGDTLFILVEGTVAVVREGPPRVTLWELTEGEFFGEYALLTDLERTATVETLNHCTVLSISRPLVRELVQEHPPVLKSLLYFFRDRMVGNLLRTHELFKLFTWEERRAVMRQFTWLEAQPGQVLVEASHHPDGLYLLVSGHATVKRSGKLQTALCTGEMFCKTALLNGTPSSHTVRTVSKCWLLRLPREKFLELIMTHPNVLTTLSEARATGTFTLQDLGVDDREETLKVV